MALNIAVADRDARAGSARVASRTYVGCVALLHGPLRTRTWNIHATPGDALRHGADACGAADRAPLAARRRAGGRCAAAPPARVAATVAAAAAPATGPTRRARRLVHGPAFRPRPHAAEHARA